MGSRLATRIVGNMPLTIPTNPRITVAIRRILGASARLADHATSSGSCCHIRPRGRNAVILPGWIGGSRAGDHSRAETAGPSERVWVSGDYWTIGSDGD